MEGVILAAGLGTRLGGRGMKPLYKVGGMPLIYYPLSGIAAAGIDRVVIVVNPLNASQIRRLVEERICGIDVSLIVNEEPNRENGYSLKLALEHIEGDAVLSMSDHIHHPGLYKLLARGEGLLVAGDKKPLYIDIGEATKLLVDDAGRVVRAGKSLERYGYIDTGAFLVSRGLRGLVEELAAKHRVLTMSMVMEESYRAGTPFSVIDVTGMPWIEIDTPRDAERAEKLQALITAYRRLASELCLV